MEYRIKLRRLRKQHKVEQGTPLLKHPPYTPAIYAYIPAHIHTCVDRDIDKQAADMFVLHRKTKIMLYNIIELVSPCRLSTVDVCQLIEATSCVPLPIDS